MKNKAKVHFLNFKLGCYGLYEMLPRNIVVNMEMVAFITIAIDSSIVMNQSTGVVRTMKIGENKG